MLTSSSAIRRACLDANSDDGCLGVITWMHTFSPAKMWIHGLDELRKPLLHLHTQANEALPWSTIDMDFMNLNQAAHGDREFAHVADPLGVARKTVAGHVSDPEVTRRVDDVDLGGDRRASAAQPAPGALRRQHAQRRRHRRRQGRGRTPLRRVGQHVRGQRPRGRASTRSPTLPSTRSSRRASTPTTSRPSCAPAVSGPSRCATRARIEAGLRQFLDDGGYGAFTTNFEDLGGLRQLPGLAVQRLMADGYGFGGEGDWKTAALVHTLKAMSAGQPGRDVVHGGLHVPPRPRRAEGARRPHARGVSVDHDGGAAGRDPSAEHRRPRGSRCASCSPPTPARASSSASPISATVSASCSTASISSPPTSRCPSSRWPTPCGSRDPTYRRRWSRGCAPAGRTTPCLSTAVDTEAMIDLAEILRTELVVIDEHTTTRSFADELRWNQAYYRLAQGSERHVGCGVPRRSGEQSSRALTRSFPSCVLDTNLPQMLRLQLGAERLRGVGGGLAGVVLAHVGEAVAARLPER